MPVNQTTPLNNDENSLWIMPGGIHPLENKAQSLTSSIQVPLIPELLTISISQPDYKQPLILVDEGDLVLKGQVLAKGQDSEGLVCHASSSGKVKNIKPMPIPNSSGLSELCISIATDQQDTWTKHQGLSDFLKHSSTELITLIKHAGINGLGGAGFPTYKKLNSRTENLEALIINACECEPFISADDALMRERSEDIIQGIKILLHILKPKKCIVGIEDNKLEALSAMQRVNDDARITFSVLPTKYPSGSEKQLIQIVTGIQIPSGSLAVQHGILCQNIATTYAIARAINHGEPLISRITTLTGAALESPCNQEVLIGTPISSLLENCGLNKTSLSQLIMGGSLMGIQLNASELPILKTSTCIIATSEEELPSPPPAQACIRCGLCAEACPVSLLPQQLYWFARSKEHAKAKQHNLLDCIECGACAYVCPSHIPLVQYYRASKTSIREEQALQNKASLSQQRFEARAIRIEKNKVLAEKRRAQRAELAKQNRNAKTNEASTTLDPIQAALARVKAKANKANN